MTEQDLEREFAERRYGYGRWNARHMFIGPEEGMMKEEKLRTRIAAWEKLGKLELDDCKAFHEEIGVLQFLSRRNGKDEIQPTWKALILALLAYRGKRDITDDDVVQCQREEWGNHKSDTCVIELSALAAHNLKVQRATYRGILEHRITHIEGKISEANPGFVLLYGQGRNGSRDKAWRALTGSIQSHQYGLFEIVTLNQTLFVKAPHPKAPTYGNSHEAWIKLGRRLREMSGREDI